MSANNWKKCHVCRKQLAEKADAKLQSVQDMYGKVPSAQYLAALREAQKLTSDSELDDSLREDYRLGIRDDGSYMCSYSASCDVCGFGFTDRREVSAETVAKGEK